jgi:NADH-quinone oxidoreductase subunit H
MISYEVFFSLIILVVLLLTKSAGFVDIVMNQYYTLWYIIPCFPLAIVFFIAILAETNRTPFDLPEAEAEIVAGYNIEYSSMLFALFFLGEYGNMFALSYLFTILFLGG